MPDDDRTTPAPSGQEGHDATPSGQEGATPTPSGQEGQQDAKPGGEEGKFTQADLERMLSERLKRERKKWDEEKQEIEKRAKMDEQERIKAEKEDAEKRAQEAEARAIQAQRRADLAGKVADPQAALRLIDEDTHVTEDGAVNVDKLLESYPFLAPQRQGPAPTSTGGGTTPKPATIEQRMAEAERRGDWGTWAQLEALRQQRKD